MLKLYNFQFLFSHYGQVQVRHHLNDYWNNSVVVMHQKKEHKGNSFNFGGYH